MSSHLLALCSTNGVTQSSAADWDMPGGKIADHDVVAIVRDHHYGCTQGSFRRVRIERESLRLRA